MVPAAPGTLAFVKINSMGASMSEISQQYIILWIQCAEEVGKHLCLLKSRRKGFSYKGGAMACRNYYLIPTSKTFIYASNK